MIKIGDRVKFLSDTGVGVVVSIKGTIATVEMEDGFDIPAPLTDLVPVDEEQERRARAMIGTDDPKPGSSRRKKEADGEKKAPKKVAAYSRYGKVSLLDDDDDEEEQIDVTQLRESYLKSVAAATALENEAFEREFGEKRSAVTEETVENEVKTSDEDNVSDVDAESETTAKPRRIALEDLGRVVGGSEDASSQQKQNVSAPKTAQKGGKQKKTNEEEVVDLHAEEVLESTEGMAPGEILDAQLSRFDMALSLAVNSGSHGRIVFIHGVGKGKLKYELEKMLRRKYPRLSWQDASFAEYGYGAIMVFY